MAKFELYAPILKKLEGGFVNNPADEGEVWKDIPGFDGVYLASNYGRIKSLPRNGTIKKERILAPSNDRYLTIGLRKNGVKKRYPLHRIIAETFCYKPAGSQCVDHIDGNTHNNRADNLRWCTFKENSNNPITRERHIKANKVAPRHRKRIAKCDSNGTIICVFNSITEAAKSVGSNKGNIIRVAKGCKNAAGKNCITAAGYKWRYV